MESKVTDTYASVSEGTSAGLRKFCLGVYNRMFGALLLTALLAYASTVPPLRDLLFVTNAKGDIGLTILGWIVTFAPLGIVLFFGGAAQSSRGMSAFMLWACAALFGLGLGTVVMAYTTASLAVTFLATAGAFGALSLWGYTTKRNLSGWGNFLLIALFGLIIAMIVNLFIASTVMQWIVTIAGILIFAGLTAYDTQKMKDTYWSAMGDDESLAIGKNNMAFALYLDFLNLFLLLLRLFGVNAKSD